MRSQTNIFNIELSSENHLWWHFNLFVTVVCYDSSGEKKSFVNAIDNDSRQAECTTRPPMKIESLACDNIELFVYAIAAVLPASDKIGEAEPFEATVVVRIGNQIVRTIPCDVNQYGGVTITGEKIDSTSAQLSPLSNL